MCSESLYNKIGEIIEAARAKNEAEVKAFHKEKKRMPSSFGTLVAKNLQQKDKLLVRLKVTCSLQCLGSLKR